MSLTVTQYEEEGGGQDNSITVEGALETAALNTAPED